VEKRVNLALKKSGWLEIEVLLGKLKKKKTKRMRVMNRKS